MKVGDIIIVGEWECCVKQQGSSNQYWLEWENAGYLKYLKKYCPRYINMSTFTHYELRPLDLSIKYRALSCIDSPDFYDLENLEKYISLLENYIWMSKISILK